MVKGFAYTARATQALRHSLSQERLSTYLAATAGDIESALRLYNWNAEISGALYSPLQGLEIALRNAMHYVLAESYGTTWYEHSKIPFEEKTIHEVKKAREILTRRNANIIPPNVVAELSFGFWVSLLGSPYHNTLWTPTLHKAFPNMHGKRHKEVYYVLNQLRKLRNRIAHHEPIFKRHLSADYHSIITTIGWICCETALWVDSHSIFHETLEAKVRLGIV